MTDLPHFAYPFRFATPRVAVTEQDSIDEIGDCVLVVLLTPLGYRSELPEFGTSDPTFSTQPLNLEAISEVVDTWEPRAALTLDRDDSDSDALVARIEAYVSVRTEV